MDPYFSSGRHMGPPMGNPMPVPIVNSANTYGKPAFPPHGPHSFPPGHMGFSQPGPTTLVINQVAPAAAITAHTSSPFPTTCNHCKNAITTLSVKSCNCAAYCLCCWTGWLIYCIIQACRDKDCCCYDAIHTCPSCGNTVATYKAC